MHKDTPRHYGTISRLLHWITALLLLWQFISAFGHLLLEDTPVGDFLWSSHKTLGLVIILLVAVRLIWAVWTHPRRPAAINRFAAYGHCALYALMLLIPALALLRQFGSGRSFSPFGIPLMPGFEGEAIEWMTLPANVLHSWLGWLLLAMIAGHIVMARAHRHGGDINVLERMTAKR
ncbi:cytochrome b [Marinobacter sp. 1Y8]